VTRPFVVRMAWRETRGAWRHVVLFVTCVALGVAALVGVGTFAANLQRTLGREARALMGGDVELRSARPLGAAAHDELVRLRARGATTVEIRELAGMARNPRDGRSVLAEIKAVGTRYPLYGRLEIDPDRPLVDLLAGHGALVESALLDRLGLAVGDRVLVGSATFTIRGLVRREPDRAGGLLTLGPRVLLADDALDATGLVRFGSRVRHRALVRLPDETPAAPVRDDLIRALDDPAVRVIAFDEAQSGLKRFFAQLTTYLGLTGLVSLLVGGIGVASAVRTFIRRKTETIAILKCVGATSRTLFASYLLQALALGMVGSALGVGLGLAFQPLAVRAFAGLAPFPLEPSVDVRTLLRAITMGVMTTGLVVLWPLGSLRAIPPSAILRQDVEPASRRRPWLALVSIASGLAALAIWQAGSLKIGGLFVLASIAALLGLAALGRGLAWLARALPRAHGFAWRQGVANLYRPGGQVTGVVVALGLGVMLLVAIGLLEDALERQIDHERRREAPSFFFVDVQADQREPFARLLATSTGSTPTLIPIVRARLASVDGEPVGRPMLERRRAAGQDTRWYFTRDYALTSMAEPPAENVILRGRWWGPDDVPAGPRVSVEDVAAKALGVDVGSSLGFDVQGVRIEARVASIRKVDWQSFSTNFFVIFSPGALDGAPTTFVATARVDPAAEARVQDAVVAAFPNVTVVPVRDILQRAAGILGQIAFAIRAIALFSIAAGLTVMAGTLAASRRQRLTESAILRTLGASRAAVARVFAVEYACLGTAAGVGGTVLATALAWTIQRFVLEVPPALAPGLLASGVGIATATALAVGFLTTYRLLGQPPLTVLRHE
jgi:putative ABC transport system permease protein